MWGVEKGVPSNPHPIMIKKNKIINSIQAPIRDMLS